ncbi:MULTISPECIES: glycosyltransferase family 1 protein [Roseateles]|uniref:Glycosyltransferase involved in cell wall biosynthesis n=1 Tax=Pelomonas aquatica TaxID=431058 RepID=A0ABU1ZB12_9BURK|nr:MULTISPECIES: glycosyltransferase family 1 protein [Roseateles]KQY88878.1 glycoside hydrolase [Pelomonas sp. Root1444]MDR7297817.1 glycosyltransferase involved in cell wall biosynthesis [Pelomonas aquatica]
MRIAYVTETFPPEINGVALTAERAVRHLRAAGHAVQLIRPRRPEDAPCRNAEEWRCGGGPIPMYPELRYGWATPAALRELWRETGGLPDIVHVTTPGPLGWAALRAAQAEGLPASADFRTNFHAYCSHYGLGWLEPVVLGYLKRLHAMAATSFVPTRELARQLAAHGFERLQVLGRGVDPKLFTPKRRDPALRQDWRAGSDSRVLLYVGRLAAEKNAGLALQTFERLSARRPGLRMVVVGDGPMRAKLQRAHPRARFVGMQTGTALARHYASADVFLFPSLTDTFGNVVLEALASGLAVAAFDTAAPGQHVRDGISGCLAPACDGLEAADAFLDAATRALDASEPDGLLRLEARLTATQADWTSVLHRFEQELQQLAAAGQPVPGYAAMA